MAKQTEGSAREAARKTAAGMKGGATRSSFKWLVLAGVFIVVAATVVVLSLNRTGGTIADSGDVPGGGNEFGGISAVGPDTLAETPAAVVDLNSLPALPEEQGEAMPLGLKVAEIGEPVQVIVYQDPNCSHCSTFEETYGPTLREWVGAGEIELEHRNVAFLDGGSPTNYSSRASNALACVADQAPASYLHFSEALFAHQPEGEMTNAQLADMASEYSADVSDCITDGTFRPFVKYTTTAAQVAMIPGTPSVFVNGEQWDGQADTDFNLWARGLIESTQAVG